MSLIRNPQPDDIRVTIGDISLTEDRTGFSFTVGSGYQFITFKATTFVVFAEAVAEMAAALHKDGERS